MKEKLLSIALGAIGAMLSAALSHYTGVQVIAGGAEAVVVGSLTPMAFTAVKGALGVV